MEASSSIDDLRPRRPSGLTDATPGQADDRQNSDADDRDRTRPRREARRAPDPCAARRASPPGQPAANRIVATMMMSDRARRRVEALRKQLAAEVPSRRSDAGARVSATSARIRCAGNHAMPFEAWEVGQLLETKRRTINEADVINFTHMTGYDAENLFGDMEYLKNVAGHKRRLVPGLLTASIADALIVGSGILEGYAVALVSMNDVVAKAPVYGGDTLQVLLEVTETKPSKSKPDRGFVTTAQQVVNQDGVVVMEYKVTRLLRRSK